MSSKGQKYQTRPGVRHFLFNHALFWVAAAALSGLWGLFASSVLSRTEKE